MIERLLPDFPELKLVIVGDGPFKSRVEDYIVRQGLQDRVRLKGFDSEEEKIHLLQHAAVHLQSSYKEGWGLSVIEANACGCAVVANNTTGLCDSVVDGESGLLYDYCDLDDAAGKVKLVLSDSELHARLIESGCWRGSEFSWERNSDEMIEYLEQLAREAE